MCRLPFPSNRDRRTSEHGRGAGSGVSGILEQPHDGDTQRHPGAQQKVEQTHQYVTKQAHSAIPAFIALFAIFAIFAIVVLSSFARQPQQRRSYSTSDHLQPQASHTHNQDPAGTHLSPCTSFVSSTMRTPLTYTSAVRPGRMTTTRRRDAPAGREADTTVALPPLSSNPLLISRTTVSRVLSTTQCCGWTPNAFTSMF